MKAPEPRQRSTLSLQANDPAVRWMRRVLSVVGAVSTVAAARLAEALFCRSGRPPMSERGIEFLAAAHRDDLTVRGRRIARYRWGTPGTPLIVLVHGWRGNAGRFAQLGNELLKRKMQLVAFDAPGHGRSAGWRASMPEFAQTLEAVVAETDKPHGVVGHSLGGAATIFASSRGMLAERIVTISAPAEITVWVDRFREALQLDESVYAIMRRNMQRRIGVGWHELDMERAVSGLTATGLVIHDLEDLDVPIAEAQALADRWQGAKLYTTTGLGHRRILEDPAVVEEIATFFS